MTSQEGGKFKDDFRITTWGRVLRKLWIDELPQFINFFKGELSLVGVRALSDHYFQLYPKDVQELR
jgi:lipopolysaccharide/colanic/teichoic acid biosynthesis glycosyltransferase